MMNKRDKLKVITEVNNKLEQSYLKSKGLLKEDLLKEVEDLELKNVAKKLFSVAKKYGLKPNYETKTVNFQTKPSESEMGYGARIIVTNGMLTIAIYDRGVLQSIRRGGFPGVESKEVSNSTDKPSDESNVKGLSKALGIIFKAFMAELPQDKFETKNTGNKPNEYSYYIIYAKPKSGQK